MYNYRISKYRLCNRTKNNLFNEWTSISDIGEEYNGKKFLYEDYIKMENNYIEAMLMFVKLNNVTYITIDKLEKYVSDNEKIEIYDEYDLKIANLINKIQNGINIYDINLIARAILREKIWCKLYSDNELYIHFGYDYYMYIGSKMKPQKEIEQIKKLGLEVEEIESPYSMEE